MNKGAFFVGAPVGEGFVAVVAGAAATTMATMEEAVSALRDHWQGLRFRRPFPTGAAGGGCTDAAKSYRDVFARAPSRHLASAQGR
ncbi:hypothetical protein DNJ95_02865 [Stutzerimonas kirkiae]|uniref:Uncharacterized protein n=1 Tax=Stutzerimonas kirkiae TaxID=2211392 RepID=A0A4Q9RFT1_9GAMM|nr:hypothetical protein DNJ96_00930 [Stutzerimonas kirkiae]TBV05177.1 hypothetical protein DNJ95_02865 [Stutzerimonas kirkiae]